MISCKDSTQKGAAPVQDFPFNLEQFADIRIHRYPVPGFDELNLQQKTLLYYLSQAAIEGRDIVFDQNYRYNLAIRRTLESIRENYAGDRNTDEFKASKCT